MHRANIHKLKMNIYMIKYNSGHKQYVRDISFFIITLPNKLFTHHIANERKYVV